MAVLNLLTAKQLRTDISKILILRELKLVSLL